MTLREYIEELGFDDYEHFFLMELSSLVLMPAGALIPENRFSLYLDYQIQEIEHHIELERSSLGPNDQCAEYYIITLYGKESEA